MSVEKLLPRLKGVRHVGDGKVVAICPAHQDKTPSLSVLIKPEKALLHCFAGCATADVLDAIGLTFSDLYADDPDRAAYSSATANGGKKFQRQFKVDPLEEDKTVVRIAQQWMREGRRLSLYDQARLDLALSRLDKAGVANG